MRNSKSPRPKFLLSCEQNMPMVVEIKGFIMKKIKQALFAPYVGSVRYNNAKNIDS
jgi:hypothetical protein